MDKEKEMYEKMKDALLDKYSPTLNRWKNWRAGRVSDVNRMDIESFIAYEVLLRKVIPAYAIEHRIVASKKSPKMFCKDKECLAELSKEIGVPSEIINLRLQSRKQDLTKLPHGEAVFIAVYGQLDDTFTFGRK